MSVYGHSYKHAGDLKNVVAWWWWPLMIVCVWWLWFVGVGCVIMVSVLWCFNNVWVVLDVMIMVLVCVRVVVW